MIRPVPETLTVLVPFSVRKRGGRREVIIPAGTQPKRPRVENTVLKALARAFRWKRMLESGAFATIGDLAAHEKIAPSYMTRVMRMTLLAPEIVEGIVVGQCDLGLAELLEPFPVDWAAQILTKKPKLLIEP